MLTPDEVVDNVRDLWTRHQDELLHHDRVYGFLRGTLGIPEVPEGAGDELKDIAAQSVLNIVAPVVEAFTSPLSVEGFRSANAATNADVWRLWQADRLDARQGEVYRPAVAYGSSYAITLRSETRLRTPRQCIAVYADPSMDLWPTYVLEHWLDFTDAKPKRRGRLYDETHIYPVELGNAGTRFKRIDGEMIGRQAIRVSYEPTEAIPHGATYQGIEVCPGVRFVNERDAEDVVLGEVWPLIVDQRRMNVANFDRLVVSRFGAFLQKYAIGWAPATSADLSRTSAARLMAFEDQDVKVGSFQASPLDPYNNLIKDLKVDAAKKAQVPVGAIMDKAENVGADTIAALDAPYQAKLNAKRRSFGESWEQHLRLKGELNGVEVPDDAEVVWDTTEARSFAQVVDGISKLAAANPALLPELLQDVPGWNYQRIQSAQAAMRRGAGRETLDALRAAAGGDAV